MDWYDVNLAVEKALTAGWMLDFRTKLPRHETRRFQERKSPNDILGVCSHQSGSQNQDIMRTAKYHIGPNHVSSEGCPGLLYSLVISQEFPGKVLLANDFRLITWSQGAGGEHVGDENRHLLSLLVMGDFYEDSPCRSGGAPTCDQIRMWKKATTWLRNLFGFDGHGYFGHHHFGKGTCPGKSLRQLIECRRMDYPGLEDAAAWQSALLRWDPSCLPKYGADGFWGEESRQALVRFEKAYRHKVDGLRDPFTELLLLKKYSK